MIYPKFIIENSTIGMCAPSAGAGHKLDDYLQSRSILEKAGYNIKESATLRSDKLRSASAKTRAKELDELVCDDDVDMIMAVNGGDVAIEMLPYIKFENIKKHPKWIMGYSDPTNLLFPVTTSLDIATIYGFNGSSYTLANKLDQRNNLNILKGKMIKQKSFKQYQEFLDYCNQVEKYQEVYYKTNKDIDISGRCIGGCLDCIEKIIGTKYDNVNNFIDKYKNDGIVWYFDNFALSAFNTYLTLLQFKNAGWFRHCKGILFGRVAIPNTKDSPLIKSYEQAYRLALKGIPYVSEMDIGHSLPRMTMINGAIIDVKVNNGKGSIGFVLK